MATRIIPILLLCFSLAGCCSTVDQVQPALDTAALLDESFTAEQTNTLAFIESGNPPAAQLEAFKAAQVQTRVQFLSVYRAHVQHLMSIGQFDPALIDSTLEGITSAIERLRGDR